MQAMLVQQMGFELLDALELDLAFCLGRLTALLPLVDTGFADSARDPAHGPHHPVMVGVVEPHLCALVVPVIPGLALDGRGRERGEIADRLGAVPHCLAREKPRTQPMRSAIRNFRRARPRRGAGEGLLGESADGKP